MRVSERLELHAVAKSGYRDLESGMSRLDSGGDIDKVDDSALEVNLTWWDYSKRFYNSPKSA